MKLIVEYTNDKNEKIIQEYLSQIISIGSSETNNIILPPSTGVSKHHASIVREGDYYILYSHSYDGTFLDTKFITKDILPPMASIILGPKGTTIITKIEVLTKTEKDEIVEIPKRRWYDHYPLINLSLTVLQEASPENVDKTANFLVDALKGFNKNDLLQDLDINLEDIISSIRTQNRWYDQNDKLKELIETIKYLKPEIQEQLILDIIKILDCFEDDSVKDDYYDVNK